MRIGCRAHDFGKGSAQAIAAGIAAEGFESVQLAPGKAIEGAPRPEEMDAAWARSTGAALAARGVSIAVLGCYVNPIHPDRAERNRSLDRFARFLALARDFGGCGPGVPQAAPGHPLAFPVVATETGSHNADTSWHAGNSGDRAFGELVESLARIAEAAEAADAMACVEGVVRHVACTPARLRAAIDAVGSPKLMVLFDPVNYLDGSNWRDQERMYDEAEDLLSDRLLVVHAKDFVPTAEGGIGICPAGKGLLDYPRLMRMVRKARPEADVMIEDIGREAMADARRFILTFADMKT